MRHEGCPDVNLQLSKKLGGLKICICAYVLVVALQLVVSEGLIADQHCLKPEVPEFTQQVSVFEHALHRAIDYVVLSESELFDKAQKTFKLLPVGKEVVVYEHYGVFLYAFQIFYSDIFVYFSFLIAFNPPSQAEAASAFAPDSVLHYGGGAVSEIRVVHPVFLSAGTIRQQVLIPAFWKFILKGVPLLVHAFYTSTASCVISAVVHMISIHEFEQVFFCRIIEYIIYVWVEKTFRAEKCLSSSYECQDFAVMFFDSSAESFYLEHVYAEARESYHVRLEARYLFFY